MTWNGRDSSGSGVFKLNGPAYILLFVSVIAALGYLSAIGMLMISVPPPNIDSYWSKHMSLFLILYRRANYTFAVGSYKHRTEMRALQTMLDSLYFGYPKAGRR